MNTKKYLAALLAILICLLSGCRAPKAEEVLSTTAPAAVETTQPQEATVPELPQDEKMDLLSFADQTPEEATPAEEPETVPETSAAETVPAASEAVSETVPEAEIPAATATNGETVPLISGNENQLPLG